jgi:2-polyprenyl-6-methoxyphenol hydroxylase-like FAD-dependent oxidoreductase
MAEHRVVVVGAGPAGLSVALSLRDRGMRPLVIDRAIKSAHRGAAATTSSG